ncbi:MAG: hypothetical protein ABIZ91_04260 [Gemmatimonadaceae bacterium]
MPLAPTDSRPDPALARRSFLGRVSAAVAAFSAGVIASPSPLEARPSRRADDFRPARHAQDDWLDAVPGSHRFFFDATTPTGAGEAITFASNYYVANKSGYGLEPSDLAVVICLRHWATPFAFNDAIWKKYGTFMAERIKFNDPATQAAPLLNVYQATNYGMQLPNRGTTLDAMVARGTHFAICDMAARAFAGIIAGKTGSKSDDVYAELKASVLGNAHFAAAGIVAVNRAQERGYSVQYIG